MVAHPIVALVPARVLLAAKESAENIIMSGKYGFNNRLKFNHSKAFVYRMWLLKVLSN